MKKLRVVIGLLCLAVLRTHAGDPAINQLLRAAGDKQELPATEAPASREDIVSALKREFRHGTAPTEAELLQTSKFECVHRDKVKMFVFLVDKLIISSGQTFMCAALVNSDFIPDFVRKGGKPNVHLRLTHSVKFTDREAVVGKYFHACGPCDLDFQTKVPIRKGPSGMLILKRGHSAYCYGDQR